MAFLIIERGTGSGERIQLKSFPVTLGRDKRNSIVIRDQEASRHHLRIKKRGNLYILEDLESRNGTYVNGDRVVNSTLKNGDKILLGSTELLFHASEPNIKLVNELLDFDIQFAERSELGGPINVAKTDKRTHFDASRVDPFYLGNALVGNAQAMRDVYNHHSNLLVIDNITEASKTLLKSLGQLMPHASRSVLFVWSESSRQLLPVASKTYGNERPFFLNQGALEDAISRRQGIILNKGPNQTTDRTRIILPMLHNEYVVCLLHIEYDDMKEKISDFELELAQSLLNRSSPIFESMLLRKELDSWLVGMIETMVATVEAKDTYTRGHSERVSRYCMVISDELKLKREIKKQLCLHRALI